jgi:stress response protein YsnF
MSTSTEKLRSKEEMLDMAAESYKTLQVKVVEAIEARK